MAEQITLGAAGVRTSSLGIGTWAWGDKLFWSYGSGYSEAELGAAFDAALAGGVTLFDTAEIYGRGLSERILGRLVRERGAQVEIATKFMPYPWRLRRGDLLRALRASLARLGVERVALYQFHQPLHLRAIEFWMDEMAEAVQQGLCQSVGVSNYSTEQMQRAHDQLAKRGVPLAANQVEYSLLQRDPERSGLLAACQQLGVTLIAYSPLAMGLLTGKYTPQNRPPGIRGMRYKPALLARLQPLIALLHSIGAEHGDKTPAQVSLNWLLCKGTLPIPGAKNARQAADNLGALGWRLTPEQVAQIDAALTPAPLH